MEAPPGKRYLALDNVTKSNSVFVTILPKHTEIPIYSKVTYINCKSVTLQTTHLKLLQSCLGTSNAFMPRQDRNKNTIRFGNVVLGQVTLSYWGAHRLDCITPP